MRPLIWKELRALRTPAYVVLALMVATGALQLWYEGTHDIAGGPVTVLWWIALPLVALGLGCYLIARDRARGELPFGSS